MPSHYNIQHVYCVLPSACAKVVFSDLSSQPLQPVEQQPFIYLLFFSGQKAYSRCAPYSFYAPCEKEKKQKKLHLMIFLDKNWLEAVAIAVTIIALAKSCFELYLWAFSLKYLL